jgi:hypothetical protein
MEQHKKGADVLTLGLLRHDVSEVHLKLKRLDFGASRAAESISARNSGVSSECR